MKGRQNFVSPRQISLSGGEQRTPRNGTRSASEIPEDASQAIGEVGQTVRPEAAEGTCAGRTAWL